MTIILLGEDSIDWWNKVQEEQNQPLGLVPTPMLEQLRQDILAEARGKDMTKQEERYTQEQEIKVFGCITEMVEQGFLYPDAITFLYMPEEQYEQLHDHTI